MSSPFIFVNGVAKKVHAFPEILHIPFDATKPSLPVPDGLIVYENLLGEILLSRMCLSSDVEVGYAQLANGSVPLSLGNTVVPIEHGDQAWWTGHAQPIVVFNLESAKMNISKPLAPAWSSANVPPCSATSAEVLDALERTTSDAKANIALGGAMGPISPHFRDLGVHSTTTPNQAVKLNTSSLVSLQPPFGSTSTTTSTVTDSLPNTNKRAASPITSLKAPESFAVGPGKKIRRDLPVPASPSSQTVSSPLQDDSMSDAPPSPPSSPARKTKPKPKTQSPFQKYKKGQKGRS